MALFELTAGGLLIATFGNATELIISIHAMTKWHDKCCSTVTFGLNTVKHVAGAWMCHF